MSCKYSRFPALPPPTENISEKTSLGLNFGKHSQVARNSPGLTSSRSSHSHTCGADLRGVQEPYLLLHLAQNGWVSPGMNAFPFLRLQGVSADTSWPHEAQWQQSGSQSVAVGRAGLRASRRLRRKGQQGGVSPDCSRSSNPQRTPSGEPLVSTPLSQHCQPQGRQKARRPIFLPTITGRPGDR